MNRNHGDGPSSLKTSDPYSQYSELVIMLKEFVTENFFYESDLWILIVSTTIKSVSLIS